MKKRLVSIVLSIGMAAGLVGCTISTASSDTSDSASETSTETAEASEEAAAEETPSGETKTLQFMWFSDTDVETQTMRSILDGYEAENPGIKVELVEVPYADLDQKLTMAITGGEPPALARVTRPEVYYSEALVLNDSVGGSEAFLANYPDSIRANTNIYDAENDNIIAIPMELSVCTVIYNKTAFEKAGVEAPASSDECWTWEEFNEAMKKCIDSGAVRYGLDLDRTTQRWSNVFYEFGGRFLDDDGNPCFTSEAARAALEFTKQSFDEGLWASSVYLGNEDSTNLFVSGQCAAHIGGSWKVGAYTTDITDFEWGVTYLPYETVRANCTGPKFMMGFQGSGCEEEAADLLAYLASDAANSWYTECNFISPRNDAGDLTYAQNGEKFAILSEDAAASNDAYTKDSFAAVGYLGGMNTNIIDAVCEYLAGELTVDECMAQIDSEGAELLETLE